MAGENERCKQGEALLRGSLHQLGLLVLCGIATSILYPEYASVVVCVLGSAAVFLLLRIGAYLKTIEREHEENSLKLLREVVVGLQKEETLRQATRLREEFLDTVAHEFRTPLTAVHGFSRALIEDQSTVTNREALKYIYQGAEKLKQLLDRLMFTRAFEDNERAAAIEDVHSQKILNAVAAHAQSVAESYGLHLLCNDAGRDGVVLRCDHELISNVLVSVIGQVAEFALPHSTISLTIDNKRGDSCFSVVWEHRGQGIGSLATMLHQSQPDGAAILSLGNGVSFAASVVALHGGTITLSQIDSKRTAIELRVPQAGVHGKEGDCHHDSVH